MRLAALAAVLESCATVQRKDNVGERRSAERDFVALHANPFILLHAATRRLFRGLAQPRLLTVAAIALFAAIGSAAALPLAAVPIMGTFEAMRTFPLNGTATPTDGGTSSFKLTRGMVESGVMIDVLYSVNVTTTGAAVRAYSLPIRRITLVGANTGGSGTTLQQWYARDLIAFAQVFEQAPIGGLIVPPSGFGVANYTGLEAHVPLMFNQPSKTQNPDMTSLPTFAYSDLTLNIEWGTVTDLLTGTPVGAITFTAGGATVTQLDYADLPIPTSAAGLAIARQLPRSIARYAEMTQTALANTKAEIDLGTSENLRAILLVCELTSTREPTNTIVNTISLQEDNTNYVHTDLPWTTLRAWNARHFGLTMPTGVAVLDFAQDGNAEINRIYRAVQKGKVKLILNTAAVAGTVRAALLGVAPPLNV